MKWFKKHKNKNQALFDGLISRYHGALYKHALWMTGNADLAADMVQEAYFQAWSCFDSLQNESKALPWLLTILRRAVYREQRCQYRHMETIDQLQQFDEQTMVENPYTLQELYSLLEDLSAVQREAFLLYALHGFTYSEISRQLDVPIGTVMSRISRAKEALRSLSEAPDHNIIKFHTVKRGDKS